MDESTGKIIAHLMMSMDAIREDYKNTISELTGKSKEEITERLNHIVANNKQRVNDKIIEIIGKG